MPSRAIPPDIPIPPDAHPRGASPPDGRQVWHEDAQGRRHGPALSWHASGNPRMLTLYEHGRREGPHRSWHPTGEIENIGHYENDREVGAWRRFNTEGQQVFEQHFAGGWAEGEGRAWYDDGTLARTWSCCRGLDEGSVRVFTPDGSLYCEESYIAGLRSGPCRFWLAGHLIEESLWQNGVMHGPFLRRSYMGPLEEEGSYLEGARDGLWRRWSWGEILASEGIYQADRRQGSWRFYENGQLVHEGEYAEGKPIGIHHLRQADGQWIAIPAEGLSEPEDITTPPPAPVVQYRPLPGYLAGPVPTTLVTGFLGAGKTTLIQRLIESRPAGERWVIYVNDVGEVGIDGSVFADTGAGLFVRELAGGCACCTSSLPFVEGVAQAVDELRPDHLLLEPTGLADTSVLRPSLLAMADRLELRTTICVVDPRRIADPRYAGNGLFRHQLEACDLLVANRRDLASPEEMACFRKIAAELPGRPTLLETEQGRIDPDWLAYAGREGSSEAHHSHAMGLFITRGFDLPPDLRFDRSILDFTLRSLLDDRAILPDGWVRFKGIFATSEGVLRVDADTVGELSVLDWVPVQATGNRMAWVVPQGLPDWERIEAAVKSARL